MKKFIYLIAFAFLFCSCATTTKVLRTTIGDIKITDHNGQVLREYKTATLDKSMETTYHFPFREDIKSTEYLFVSIKNGGGLSFVDADGVSHYVSGAIILADNLVTKTKVVNYWDEGKLTAEDMAQEKDIQNLLSEHKKLKAIRDHAKEKVNEVEKGSGEWVMYKDQIEQVGKRMKEIESTLYKRYNVVCE